MSWISTFHGVVTIDAANICRTFKLENVENLSEEIISASSEKIIENKSEFLNSPSSPSLCSRFVYLLFLKKLGRQQVDLGPDHVQVFWKCKCFGNISQLGTRPMIV